MHGNVVRQNTFACMDVLAHPWSHEYAGILTLCPILVLHGMYNGLYGHSSVDDELPVKKKKKLAQERSLDQERCPMDAQTFE